MADENTPNLYELAGSGEQISYSVGGFDGRSRLRVDGREFVGDEIGVASTALGSEVTVTTEVVEDLRTVTLTVLLPAVNLREATAAELDTLAIETASATTVGGPHLVEGPVQTYRVIELRGTARSVDF